MLLSRTNLTGFDACFFCLGVSALGMTEEQYTRVTYDLTMGVAKTLLRTSPDLTFIYVSGAGTDSSERGRTMWARVKGRTENALLSLPFRAAYMFRPGAVMPLHGIRSSTRWYNVAYAVIRPIYPLLRRLAPTMVTTTEQLGRAMLAVARNGYATHVLEMARHHSDWKSQGVRSLQPVTYCCFRSYIGPVAMAGIGNVCDGARDKRFRKGLGDLRVGPAENSVARRGVSRL